jgi:hypothetical protein
MPPCSGFSEVTLTAPGARVLMECAVQVLSQSAEKSLVAFLTKADHAIHHKLSAAQIALGRELRAARARKAVVARKGAAAHQARHKHAPAEVRREGHWGWGRVGVCGGMSRQGRKPGSSHTREQPRQGAAKPGSSHAREQPRQGAATPGSSQAREQPRQGAATPGSSHGSRLPRVLTTGDTKR